MVDEDWKPMVAKEVTHSDRICKTDDLTAGFNIKKVPGTRPGQVQMGGGFSSREEFLWTM